MRIIIVGAGKVGQALCRDLAAEGNDVVLIEKQADLLESQMTVSDITGLLGNGADYDLLKEAQAGQSHVFIAVTQLDEINMIACIMAKSMGAAYTIARVRSPEYATHHEFMRNGLGIDVMINPEGTAAEAMMEVLRFPSAKSVENFAGGQVEMVEEVLSKDNPFIGLTLEAFRQRVGGRILVCILERDGEVTIPGGHVVLQPYDTIHVTGSKDDLLNFYKLSGHLKKHVQSILIIGAGRQTYYLLEKIPLSRIQVKVIERQQDTARQLAAAFPAVTVIWADGTDQDLLEEEGIHRFDAVVSLTGIDEENILISMFAQNIGVPKTITKVNRTQLLHILEPDALQTIITPKRLISDVILRKVRTIMHWGSYDIEMMHRLAENRVEVLQCRIKEGDRISGIPLAHLPLRANVLIAYLVRAKHVIIPGGQDSLQPGDTVIIISLAKMIESTDDLLIEGHVI